jgi:TP901 family phage tail tape measure protein
MEKAGTKLRQVGERFQAAGTQLTIGLTAPLAAVGVAAFKMAGDFDKSMARSTAIMGDLSDAMREDLESTARTVAKNVTFSAKETAEAYFFLASAGLDAAQSIAALPQVTQFATAGAFDLSTATDLLTDAQSALGLTVDDAAANLENMARVSDVLVKANTLANASVQQFSEALTNRAGAALRLVGKELEEGIAALAVYADQGVKGAEAGTRLDIALRELRIAASKNREEFKRLGVGVFDAEGNMRGLADIVQDLEKRLGGLSDEQKTLTLSTLGFTAKSQQALLMLVGFSDKLREYQEELKKAGGITQEVAAKQLANMSDQFEILLGRLGDVVIELGKALAPAFERLMDIMNAGIKVLQVVIEWFARWPQGLREAVAAIGVLAAALGPLILALGLLIKTLGIATAGVTALRTALTFLATHPLLILFAALGSVAIALGAFSAASATATEDLDKLGRGTETTADQIEALEESLRRATEIPKQILELTKELEKLQTLLEHPLPSMGIVEMNDLLEAINRVQQQMRDLRKELGSLNEEELKQELASKRMQKAVEEVDEAYNRFLETTAGATKELDALGGKQADLSSRLDEARKVLSAYKALLSTLAKSDAPRAKETIEGIAEATKKQEERVAALVDQQRKANVEIKESSEIMGEWEEASNQAAFASAHFGDSLEMTRLQVGLARAALVAMIEEGRKAGKTFKEIGQSRDFVDLLDVLNDRMGQIKQIELSDALDRAKSSMDAFSEGSGTLEERVARLSQALQDNKSALLALEAEGLGPTDQRIMQIQGNIAELNEALLVSQNAWVQWGAHQQEMITNSQALFNEFSAISVNAFQGFADAIGQAVAQTLIFGESFGEVFGKLAKQVAAQFIAALVSMGVQMIAFAILNEIIGKAVFQSQTSMSAGRAAAGVVASIMEVVAFPYSLIVAGIVGPAVGAGTKALAEGFAAGGGGGFSAATAMAEGGVVTAPTIALIGEAGPEAVIPLDRLGRTPGGMQTITVMLDERVLTKAVVKNMPREVRLRVGSTFL